MIMEQEDPRWEADTRLSRIIKRELRKLWLIQTNMTKHDRITRVEESFRILESALHLLKSDSGL